MGRDVRFNRRRAGMAAIAGLAALVALIATASAPAAHGGAGSTQAEPDTYQIAREGKVLLRVNIDVYGIWCISLYHPSIWDAIRVYADGVNASPDDVAASVAQALPLVIANRCGFLQPL